MNISILIMEEFYKGRQELLDLESEYGDTNLYKILESLPNNRGLCHESYRYFFENWDTEDLRIGAVNLDPEERLSLITTMKLYNATRQTDIELYLNVIRLDPAPYSGVSFELNKKVVARILEVRPDYITALPSNFIELDLYFEYEKKLGKMMRPISKTYIRFFDNKEYLFFCWRLHPKLLTYARTRHLFTPELLDEFMALHPDCDYRPLYQQEAAPKIKKTKKARVVVDRAMIEEGIRMGYFEYRIPKPFHDDEELMARVFISNVILAIKQKYPITQNMFDQIYPQTWFYMERLLRYAGDLDISEAIKYGYAKSGIVYLKYHDHYTYDVILDFVRRVPSEIKYLKCIQTIARLIDDIPGLVHEIDYNVLKKFSSLNKKSARS